MRSLLAPALLFALATPAAAGTCALHTAASYFGDQILASDDHQLWGALLRHELVDADGAPNAYHPDDLDRPCDGKGLGLDCLSNAGFPSGTWWRNVLVADPVDAERPFVQQSGPFKGYFVSMTSLRRQDFAGPTDPRSYVNADEIPYLVLPAPLLAVDGGPKIGDIGYAENLDNGKTTAFVVADEGPVEPVGEASIAFWRALGRESPNAQTGEGLPDGRIAVLVFAGSAGAANMSWPLSKEELTRAADEYLARVPGQPFRCVEEQEPAGTSDPPSPTEEPHVAAQLFDRTFNSLDDCDANLESFSRQAVASMADIAQSASCKRIGTATVKVVVDLS